MSQGAASSEERKWNGGIREGDTPPKPNKTLIFKLKTKALWLLFKQELRVDRIGGWEGMREAKNMSCLESIVKSVGDCMTEMVELGHPCTPLVLNKCFFN